MADSALCRLNPEHRLTVHSLTDEENCIVIDNVLLEPDRLVDLARRRKAEFVVGQADGYPGLQLSVDVSLLSPFQDAFRRHWRRPLSMGRPVPEMHARLSMVTFAPDRLGGMQSACHVDGPLVRPNAVVAAVLYLFHDETLGGTAFYRQNYDFRRDGPWEDYEKEMKGFFSTRRQYMGEGNRYFSPLLEVPARYNRLIMYPGHVFHSGLIRHPELLSANPDVGRLTLNIFMRCYRI